MFNLQRQIKCRHLLVGGVLLAAALGNYSCKDSYDLDEDQPSNLNSIYGYMVEQGRFSTFLQLIDDLGHKETLSKTGSKTLFVADDAAFAEFFKSNKWGVTKYADLTLAQKKLLLNSAMIDNPYPTSMLSSALGPVKGEVCRRPSSQSIYDSVQVVYRKDYEKEFPLYSDAFKSLLTRDSVVLFKDASGPATMIHFNAQFISGNKLQSSDIDFLYNQAPGTRKPDDVYVNDAHVINDANNMNVFCKNGFVHVVDKVIMPLDNMAEIIRTDSNTTIYRDIVERFAVPIDSAQLTRDYNNAKGYATAQAIDSVFVKRYYSVRSKGSSETKISSLTYDRNGKLAEATLKFDPGWTRYVSEIPSDRVGLMEDMAAMIVPDDQAMQTWWNKEGKVIQDYYASGVTDASVGLPMVPMSVLDDLVNVNMLNSLTGSVPSRFEDVLDDTNEPLGITTEDVSYVKLGSNGAVYVSNKVFPPASYSSVLFPTVIDTTQLKLINEVINDLEYDKYLNSMVSRYSFYIPTHKGLLTYVDPMSFGQTEAGEPKYQMWQFRYNPNVTNKDLAFEADVYNCRLNPDGTWEAEGAPLTTIKNQSARSFTTAIGNRFYDMLDNIIVTDTIVQGKSYYKTKGNNFIKVENGNDLDNMKVYGSWQIERNAPIKISKIFRMSNGNAYVLADQMPLGTSRSVAKRLSENEEFSTFLQMLSGCGALSLINPQDKWCAGDQQNGNLMATKQKSAGKYTISYLLNAYHYSIYAPTNEAMEAAFAMGLPTLDDLEAAELLDQEEGGTAHADSIKSVMLDFVKYHIQDNALFIDKGFEAGNYESGKTELIPSVNVAESVSPSDIKGDIITINGVEYKIASEGGKLKIEEDGNGKYTVIYNTGKYSPGRPYKIFATPTESDMTLVDHYGQTIHVRKDNGLYNIYAREYWYDGTEVKNPYAATLNNSSAVVIHAIDTPLIYNYPKRSDYKTEEEYQTALRNGDLNQFVYMDRTITNDSAIKNRSPRKIR